MTQTKSNSKAIVTTENSDTQQNREMIAEIAYCKAEQRDFVPGCEMQDWLEAEQEFNESHSAG